MKLKQYPKYRDSGVQWIGDIPEKWEVYKLKFLLSSLQSGKRESDETAPVDEGAFSLGGEHVNWNGTLNLDHVRLLSNEYYNSMNNGKIRKNDVLLVKDGATIGKTAIVKEMPYDKMAVNEHVFLMRPNNKINSKLLYYMICSDSGFTQIKLTETGSAQGGINTTFPDNVLYAIPDDKSEINPIISFLDSKTSQIEETIKKDKQLIGLLKEKRIALINHVVTKGLDKNAKMKNSGIDWIGEIPEHWSTRRIDKLSKVSRGASPRPIDDPIYFDDEGEYSWVRIADVSSSERYLEESSEKLSVLGKSLSVALEPGRLFVSIAGTVGKPIITKIKCCIHDGFVYFKNMKVNNEYLYYIFIGEQAYLGLGKWGTQLNLNTETIGLITIPLPDDKEQFQIVKYLDKETSKIDQIIKKIEEKITLMEEYKKSLIHHVVTGKVDVREAVA
jgi:type I restriction enzyme, S subunit